MDIETHFCFICHHQKNGLLHGLERVSKRNIRSKFAFPYIQFSSKILLHHHMQGNWAKQGNWAGKLGD